ncbi:MAG TPA: ABC transporter ATP-binding protein [Pyrinomonadaceae bacterium]|jgi:putative ABC transport system ATP-binding protein
MIELYRLSKEVPSGAETLTILHSLDLTIPDGQFVSIVGPSGSGKSTLLGLIAGLDAPTAGEIRIDGAAITSMDEDALAHLRGQKIGIVFQSFHLIASLTAYENVLVPMEIAGLSNAPERARRLLEEVDLTARAHHYPSQLSGGEQQRVSIARAFSNNPSILLADEPTGNLDSRNGRHVFDLMLKLNRQHNATLVLITHDHELAALADRRIALRDGRVVSDSSSGLVGVDESNRTGGTERDAATGAGAEAGVDATGEDALETTEQRGR